MRRWLHRRALAENALRDAEHAREHNEARELAARRTAEQLRELRRRNHFAEQVDRVLRERRA